MTLQHSRHNRKPLNQETQEVLRHLHRLWGFDIHLEAVQDGKVVHTYHCPDPDAERENSA